MNIGTKISLLCTATVGVIGIAVLTMWFVTDNALLEKQEQLVVRQAVNIGKNVSRQIAATRAVYAEQVVGGLKPHGVGFSATPNDGEAPLPATFISSISNQLQKGQGRDSIQFALRSGWNINKGQGIRSAFETRGWENLLAQEKAGAQSGSYEPYWERETTNDGEIIRVMTPDIASAQSCVGCHNALEQTADVRSLRNGPIKQFKRGDLMGAIVTTVPTAESYEIAATLAATQAECRNAIIALLVVGLVVAGIGSTILGRRIAAPVRSSVDGFEAFAAGDLSFRLDENRGDEIGELARAFNKFARSLNSTVGVIAADTHVLSESSQNLTILAGDLANGATDATNKSGAVAAAAEQMSVNMSNMVSATSNVSENVTKCARSVEAMTSSLNEVAQSAEDSASVAAQAAELVSVSNRRIGELGGAANEIGKVIEVIQDIAEQTNLLALNATIEAARAGESGKGFAVVATEVKELAKQTAAATDDIRQRIEGIQSSTGEAVNAIQEISDVIYKVNEFSRAIAASVEKQTSTTQDIGRNVAQTATAAEMVATGVHETAAASNDITKNIAHVDEILRRTAEGARQSKDSGDDFNRIAAQIQQLVGKFRTGNDNSIAL
ncbi:MAG: DUF3365 domain-containing protein [Planctomycetales bacterium]|nr:DUF3365 domain-containing protein [Planctomycetales bacterium]